MSAPASIYHHGVLRSAGAVHCGPPTERARAFVVDARSYSTGHLERFIEEARAYAEQRDELQRRSWVCAVADLVRWMDGDTSTGGAR